MWCRGLTELEPTISPLLASLSYDEILLLVFGSILGIKEKDALLTRSRNCSLVEPSDPNMYLFYSNWKSEPAAPSSVGK